MSRIFSPLSPMLKIFSRIPHWPIRSQQCSATPSFVPSPQTPMTSPLTPSTYIVNNAALLAHCLVRQILRPLLLPSLPRLHPHLHGWLVHRLRLHNHESPRLPAHPIPRLHPLRPELRCRSRELLYPTPWEPRAAVRNHCSRYRVGYYDYCVAVSVALRVAG
jgi:hypothetical protein